MARLVEGAAKLVLPSTLPEATPRAVSVVGHRGAAKIAPENTIHSFRAAIEQGADGVETDLCVTKDGRVILWHDRDPNEAVALARETGGEGLSFVPGVPALTSDLRRPICELTFEEVRHHYGYVSQDEAARALFGADPSGTVPIATLEELCCWFAREPRARTLALDLKLHETELGQIEPLLESLVKVCERYPELENGRLLVLCPVLETYRALASELGRRKALRCFRLVPDFELGGVVETARELGARDVSIGVTPRRLWVEVREDVAHALAARNAGELDSVTVWGADDAGALRELLAAGIDALITDEIARARAELAARVRGS